MYEKQIDLDWSEPTLQRWMSSISKESTRRGYKVCFRRYATFTGLSASKLIDEALEDSKRDEREKKDIVKTRLLGFYDSLRKEGLSLHYCNTSVQSIRSFYQTYNITVRLKGRSKLPRVKSKNRRLKITPQILKSLMDNTKSLRDRSILLILFQSGLDASSLCSLKYGDIVECLTEDFSPPLKIDVRRPKTQVDFYTFIGKDSIEALKIYIHDLESKGFKFSENTPLFLKEGSQLNKFEKITPNLIQFSFRELSKKLGYMNDDKDRNIMSPHSFRESFSSILLNNNVPDSIVDFLLGHSIGTMSEAYKKTDFEKLREMYIQIEPKLSIGNGNNNHTRIETLENTIIQLQKDSLAYKTTSETLTKKLVELEENWQKATERADHILELINTRNENERIEKERQEQAVQRIQKVLEKLGYTS